MRFRVAAAAVVDMAALAAIHMVVIAAAFLETEADSVVQVTPAISGIRLDGPVDLRNTMKMMMNLPRHVLLDDLQNLERRQKHPRHHQRHKRLIYSILAMTMSFLPQQQYLLPQRLGKSLLLV